MTRRGRDSCVDAKTCWDWFLHSSNTSLQTPLEWGESPSGSISAVVLLNLGTLYIMIVDFSEGTGWNIEAMQEFLDVPSFFETIYLVDLSPSLCEVARKRFTRLGWVNVTVVCQDARLFKLPENKSDLITLSYSLSMIPDYYSVVDSMTSLLDATGIIGVVDFYVQSTVETSGRNYIGGSLQRHVNWLGRSFWRAWFDLDRVGLEGAKRVSQAYYYTVILANEYCLLIGLSRISFRYPEMY